MPSDFQVEKTGVPIIVAIIRKAIPIAPKRYLKHKTIGMHFRRYRIFFVNSCILGDDESHVRKIIKKKC